jgi:hypothetical protein
MAVQTRPIGVSQATASSTAGLVSNLSRGMLGHASAAMTLGSLQVCRDDLDAVAGRHTSTGSSSCRMCVSQSRSRIVKQILDLGCRGDLTAASHRDFAAERLLKVS